MTDLISRADAIEAVRKELVCDGRHETHDKTCRFIADVLLSALPSADAVPIHEDGTLEVKVPNAQKVGRVLVKDVDSHIGGGLFYPDDAEQVTSKLKNPCDSLLTEDSEDSKEQKSKLDHDREWIIGCIKHDGFIKTDRFDKANQIILDALEPQTDTDYISRADLIEAIEDTDWYSFNRKGELTHGAKDESEAWYKYEDIYKAIDRVPSVSAESYKDGYDDGIREERPKAYKIGYNDGYERGKAECVTHTNGGTYILHQSAVVLRTLLRHR